jgi:hypothetical protein
MSLTSYRAAPPRDPEDIPIMPELFPYASAFVNNVKNYPLKGMERKSVEIRPPPGTTPDSVVGAH